MPAALSPLLSSPLQSHSRCPPERQAKHWPSPSLCARRRLLACSTSLRLAPCCDMLRPALLLGSAAIPPYPDREHPSLITSSLMPAELLATRPACAPATPLPPPPSPHTSAVRDTHKAQTRTLHNKERMFAESFLVQRQKRTSPAPAHYPARRGLLPGISHHSPVLRIMTYTR